MGKAANKEERFKETFSDLATQYYVAARLAARAFLVPVHGHLFHHAVEMYLKAALVGKMSVDQLRDIGHRLVALWEAFKGQVGDPALKRFDPIIQALDKFESIRYPEKIVNEGMAVSIAWKPGDAATLGGAAKQPPKYEVIIGEIDDLVIEVLDRASINPKFFMVKISGAGREALVYQNPQASRWL